MLMERVLSTGTPAVRLQSKGDCLVRTLEADG